MNQKNGLTAIISLLVFLALGLHAQAQQKYVGGDISLLTKYEEHKAKYYDHNGSAISNVLSYFKEQGWNAMRVRLFVDPSNASSTAKGQGVCQDLDYVAALGKRIKEAGLAFMLDFHYSDTWADPSNQWTPKDWQSLSDDALAQKLYDYTSSALQTLIDKGATPDFIQTGNEISYGMCWGSSSSNAKYCYPSSSASNWNRFYSLLKKATQACRDKCPSAKIILHVERVSASQQGDNKNYVALTGFYDKMKAQNIDYDIIGLSYYPYFHGPLNDLEGALNKLDSYGKDIMLVETGYPYKWAVDGTTYDYTGTFAYSDEGQKAFTDSLIALLNKHSRVAGLFWWFPEANEYGLDWNTNRVTDKWYNSSLFDNETGKATSAVSEMKKFLSTSTDIQAISNRQMTKDNAWYNVMGQRFTEPSQSGLYIHNGQKVVVKK